MYRKFLKRFLDIMVAGSAMLILSPILIIVAILVRVKLGSPVIFHQKRPGKDKKIFTLRKFRTMTDKRDEEGNLLPDEIRLTSFGKMLRATSLDELPELWNIVKGDMSLVGPRPLLVEYLPRYNEEQRHRHDVRPGLTGLAQVKGRNAISWEEKFQYDIEYVNNVSFLMDLKILFLTVKTVLVREGIHSKTSETMEVFMGSKKEDTESRKNENTDTDK